MNMFRGYEYVDYDVYFDWLIILDACRYDFFIKNWKIGKTEPRASLDSCTLKVLDKMPPMKDAVVVTGHPFILLRRNKFGKVLDAGFNHNLSTTPPDYITRTVIKHFKTIRRFPKKILWFLQPHHPYIGETKLDVRIYKEDNVTLTPQEETERKLMEARKKGILLKAYEDNLKLVLKEIKKLLTLIKGKIIITSDHAEGLGLPLTKEDKPVYSHPCGRKELEVRIIPFCVINKYY